MLAFLSSGKIKIKIIIKGSLLCNIAGISGPGDGSYIGNMILNHVNANVYESHEGINKFRDVLPHFNIIFNLVY